MGQRVRRIKTNVSGPQMVQAIIEAWKDLFGKPPTKQQVSMIMAQNALETNHRKSMWNYNVGNITTDGNGDYNYFDDLTTDEQVQPGVWKKKNLKYRAYDSLQDGVKNYLDLLRSKHYAGAWAHIINPNPIAFSKALKDAGYYTANEKTYTHAISSLYGQFSGDKSYENSKAMPDQRVADKSNFLQNLFDQITGLGKKMTAIPANNTVNTLLESYLQSVMASEKNNKKLYKKYLPYNKALIKVNGNDYTSSVEFARILCLALEEELFAKSFIHTNGTSVEVEISVPGPTSDTFKTTEQLVASLAETFFDATKKIGGVEVKTQLITNKKSSFQPINLKMAETQYRKFMLKFV